MMEDGIPMRSPFRPLQHSIHNANRDRLKDSPMDFSYDSPSNEKGHTSPSSSSWLNGQNEGGEKRSREAIDIKEVFSFGSKDANKTSGAFLFHQPLHPTLAGPDVDMIQDNSVSSMNAQHQKEVSKGTAAFSDNQPHVESLRPIASSGALTRINRSRSNVAKNKSAGVASIASEARKGNSSSSKIRRREKMKNADDWEDDVDEVEDETPVSRRPHGGRTTNIQYVFGGANRDSRRESRRSGYLGRVDPEWCLGMAQVAFNAILLLGILYLFYGIVRTLQSDVADKVREYELEFLSEVEACSHSYYLNKCGTDGEVPALAAACSSWQKCSAKDPAIVGRARVAAETVAEIVNGFVDVVSWKSMLFTLLSLVIVIGATNSTLSFFRIRSRKSHNLVASGLPHYPADSRSIHSIYSNHAYHPSHPCNASHWIPDPPSTPSKKRMCR